MRILFVCLGNICRSPSAEAVMRTLVEREGLDGSIELDSAGTSDWHSGEAPDARATQAARQRGIQLSGAARQVQREDFERFDLILAMDGSNLSALQYLAPDERAREKVRLLREFDPASAQADDLDVPDPYHGGPEGFDRVLDMLHRACENLLAHVRAQEGSPRGV
ncbi:MAG: low molecular weight protein-tyrosine-phosphatase [Solirubrobacteraceae bacterium]